MNVRRHIAIDDLVCASPAPAVHCLPGFTGTLRENVMPGLACSALLAVPYRSQLLSSADRLMKLDCGVAVAEGTRHQVRGRHPELLGRSPAGLAGTGAVS